MQRVNEQDCPALRITELDKACDAGGRYPAGTFCWPRANRRIGAHRVSISGMPRAMTGYEHGGGKLPLDRAEDAHGGKQIAQEIAAAVAHEDGGRVEVVAQEAEQAAAQGGKTDRLQEILLFVRQMTSMVSETNSPMPAARPSSPSIRLMALMTRTNQKMVDGREKYPKCRASTKGKEITCILMPPK